MLTLLIFAFIAGFITIFSPCILSIAPILLATSAQASRYKPLGIITGLIISFSFFTLALTSIVHITSISPDILRSIAIIIIIFFGLTMIIPSLEHIFTMLTSTIVRIGSTVETASAQIKTEFISGLLLGIALGLIWTPCAGPILATISTLAATNGITATTILIMIAYSIGAAVPLLALCFGGEKLIRSTRIFTPYAPLIQKIFGILIIISAVAIAFHADTFIQEKIAPLFPTITIENNDRLYQELNMLKENTFGKAPELIGITDWINSQPLTLAQLRGKVILLDFWTYTCINCIRTLPHVIEWYNKYKDHGLEIIGIHTPEFAFEKDKKHVKNAITKFNITYPVALDNNYQTWQAYNNHYWPAHYLIDQQGVIVKTHFGEGDYVAMENAICALLHLPQCTKKDIIPPHKTITPETYLGFERGDRYSPSQHIAKNQPASYQHIDMLGNDQVSLQGTWIVKEDCVQCQSDNSSLKLNFIATHVYLVMQSDAPQTITILLDDKPLSSEQIIVSEPRMYELINLNTHYGRHTLTLQCNKGLNAYVFTFG